MDIQDNAQDQAVQAILQGHNVAIVGAAGTGKSFVIHRLVAEFKNLHQGRDVQVTAATGMAALGLKDLGATTIHTYAGILDGRFSNADLAQRIKDHSMEEVTSKIRKTQTLIIDEASLISANIFNQVEYVCRQVKGSDAIFGGIQVVLVLDPRQLPPVPELLYNDTGEYCFESPLWKLAIPHVIWLKTVHRHGDKLAVLTDEVFSGNVSPESHALLAWLQRPLSAEKAQKAVHLCCDNFSANIHNKKVLERIPGDQVLYTSIDKGDTSLFRKFRAPNILALKVGCRVILLQNLDQQKGLVNGLCGEVLALNKESARVNFDNQLVVNIERKLFTCFNPKKGQIVASRLQLPLSLGYSLTIHKAQGLELPAVEVDATNIFKPGKSIYQGLQEKNVGFLQPYLHVPYFLVPTLDILMILKAETFHNLDNNSLVVYHHPDIL